jgi:hypothetical protein
MKTVEHKFVDYIPDDIQSGILYISLTYATVVHKCACGCGKEVVTPLSPADWNLLFDGETVTLRPSIGNWNFDCQSHYWITNNRVVKAYSTKKPVVCIAKELPSKKKKKKKGKWWTRKE